MPLGIVVLMLVSACAIGTVSAAAAPAGQSMYRYNPAHTGDYSPIAGSVPVSNHVQWSTAIGLTFRSSPAIWNGMVFAGSWNGKLYAFDAASGRIVWSRLVPHRPPPITLAGIDSSPAVVGGVLYATDDNGWVGAMNPATGAVKWDTVLPNYDPVMASPVVANGVVWVVTNNGFIYKLNASSGGIYYGDLQQRVPSWFSGLQSPAYSSPAVVNNVLYVGDGQGVVYAINTTTPYSALWTNATGGPIGFASPAVANGRVFIENNTNLLALSTADGHQLWSTQIGNGLLDTSPAVANGKVYVSSALPGSNMATVSAFDMSGKLIWQTQSPQGYQDVGGSDSSPAYANGMLYVGGTARTPPPGPTGDITALNATTGNIVWQQLIGGIVNTAPAVYNGVVYAADDNGVMTAIGPLTAPTLTATAPTTAFTFQNFTINGTLSNGASALPGAAITLQRSTTGTSFGSVGTTITDASGNYSFSWNESTPHAYYYRAVYAGNATYTNAMSTVASVSVVGLPTALTATAPATVNATENFTLSGQLSVNTTTNHQGIGGAMLTLYRYNGTAWVKTGLTNTTDASGGYAFTTNDSVPGSHRYEVKYAGNATYASSYVTKYVTVNKYPTALTATVPATAAVNTAFSVTGTLAVNTTTNHTGIGGATVTVYKYNATSKHYDIVVGTGTTDSTGAYGIPVTETQAGMYYYVASYAGSATYLRVTSLHIKVVVS